MLCRGMRMGMGTGRNCGGRGIGGVWGEFVRSHVHAHHSGDEELTAEGRFVTNIGAMSNVLLATGKFGVGVHIGSSALVADAIHSLTDIVSDGITLAALHFGRRPPTSKHPFGHGRFETLGTLGVSSILLVAAGGIFWHGVEGLRQLGEMSEEAVLVTQLGMFGVGAVVLSLGVKEWLFRWTLRVGQRLKSGVLVSNAWHHRSDSLSSAVALVGVGGAWAGVPWLDPIAAIGVGGLLAKYGGEMAFEALRELSDEQADDSIVEKVRTTAKSAVDKITLGQCRVRKLGHYLIVELQMGVSPLMSVTAAEELASRVRRNVREHVEDVASVSVDIFADPTLGSLDNELGQFSDNQYSASNNHFSGACHSFHVHLSSFDSDATLLNDLNRPSNTSSTSSPGPRQGDLPSDTPLPNVIESQVRQAIATHCNDDVTAVAHVRSHYAVDGLILVQLEIVPKADPTTTMHRLAKTARKVRAVVEEIPHVHRADVHLELADEPLQSERPK